MTVEEALDLIEAALNYERLNKVQELVFRESWEGRSYKEIAGNSEYHYDYIKDVGAKLWKELSEVFGEEVKKNNLQSVLKRHKRQTQINSQNHLIEVNLNGANLSGATLSVADLSGARLSANSNLSEADSLQAVLHRVAMPVNKTKSDEEEHNQGIQSNSEEEIYYWNGLEFRSQAQVKIAEALDRANVPFLPNSKVRLTTTEGRENQEFDFLVFHQGKSGILQVSESDEVRYEESDRLFQSHGIQIIKHYDATRCREEPDLIVQEFLEMLSQA